MENANDYRALLDDQQLEAVKTLDGYVRVVAGAGSGKTRVLTYRYAYLVNQGAIDPQEIACITFTRDAAQEMKTRIEGLISLETGPICTFNSMGLKILRPEMHRLHWEKKFDVKAEDVDISTVLTTIYKKLKITRVQLSYDDAISTINRLKYEYVITLQNKDLPFYAEWLDPQTKFDFDREIKTLQKDGNLELAVFYAYLKEQTKGHFIDYTDQVCIPLFLFSRYEEVLEKWQNKFSYIMVDEFQDVNSANYELCEKLSGQGNLFIVGDPNQMIYSWRGAKSCLFADFHKTHPGTVDVFLPKNRRSLEGIVNAANTIIQYNNNPLFRAMEAVRKSETKVQLLRCETDRDEADTVASRINALKQSGVKPKDIAILYRAHSNSVEFVEALERYHIPYEIHNRIGFYDRREVQAVIAYLNLVKNPDNDEQFNNAIMYPGIGLDKNAKSQLRARAGKNGESLYSALKSMIKEKVITKPDASVFVKAIDQTRNKLKKAKRITDVYDFILEKSGIKSEVEQYDYDECLNNLEILRTIVETFDYDTNNKGKLEECLELLKPRNEKDTGDGMVQLMTIHAAKGLEFDYVFSVRMVDGNFPSSRSKSPEDILEERRLAYVAYTRAKETLYLSYGTQNLDGQRNNPSQFIFEIGNENRDDNPPFNPKELSTIQSRISSLHRRQTPKVIPETLLKVGDFVTSEVWGRNIITRIDQDTGYAFIRNDKGVEKKVRYDSLIPDVRANEEEELLSNIIDTESEDAESELDTVKNENNDEGTEIDTESSDQEVSLDTITIDPYSSPGKKVHEIINQIVEKDKKKHKVYVLPLTCGTGKSSGVSEKIRDAIEKEEGLLVITDRIDRLEEYTKPKNNKELSDYFKGHKKSIALMKAGNAERIKASHHSCPVLLMCTQRYFRLELDEIKEYLKWDKGSRDLVLIDEKPDLYTPYVLKEDMLRKLYNFIKRNTSNCIEKVDFLLHLEENVTTWFNYDFSMCGNPNGRKSTFYILNQEEDELDDVEDWIDDETGETYPRPDLREPIEADDIFFNSLRENYGGKQSFKEIEKIYDVYHYLRRHRFLMSYRHDKEEEIISKFESNKNKLTDIDATVVILDGTADLSIDYYNQSYLTILKSDEPDRKLTNLHIRIVNAQGTSREELEKKRDISIFQEYVQAENTDEELTCVFTFKTIHESFEADEEGEYKEDKLRPYLGNNRGRNELQKFPVMGQVGILFSPPYRYIEHMIQQDEEWNQKLGKNGDALCGSASIIDDLSKSGSYLEKRDKDVLADIEQNIFRLPIRSPLYEGEATYYVFFDCDKYQNLKKEIEKRFGDKYYGADVKYVEHPLMMDLLKALKTDKKYVRILRYLDKQPIGSEFSKQDIMNDPEVELTKEQFRNARNNPVVDFLLNKFEINDHKRETTYRKLFDIRDIDKYASS